MRRSRTIPDPIDRQVGELIQRRRLAMGVNLKRLGDAVGLSYQQIQKYERGDNQVAASTLVAIAAALDCPAAAFLPQDIAGRSSADRPWPAASAEAGELLIQLQDVPIEFRRSLVTICQRLADLA